MSKDLNKYPEGWDADRVKELAEYYDNLPEDEMLAEDEMLMNTDETYVAIPKALLPSVRKLISKYKKGESVS